MTPDIPPLTEAQGQELNRLHMAHISAVIREQRAFDEPFMREAQQAAYKARCDFYAKVRELTGGKTGA